MYLLFIVEGAGQEILQASFSAGDFRSFKRTHTKSSKEATVTEEESSANSKDNGLAAGVDTCPECCNIETSGDPLRSP